MGSTVTYASRRWAAIILCAICSIARIARKEFKALWQGSQGEDEPKVADF